jgi:hypothetical protein
MLSGVMINVVMPSVGIQSAIMQNAVEGVAHSVKPRGRIFNRVQPFYERAVSDLDRTMNISLWV